MVMNPDLLKRRLAQRQRLERAALLLSGKDPGNGPLTKISGMSAVQIRRMLHAERQRFMAALFADIATEVEAITETSYAIANQVLDRIKARLDSDDPVNDKDLVKILSAVARLLRPIQNNVLFAEDQGKKSDQPTGGLNTETVNILVQQIHQARRARPDPRELPDQAANVVPDDPYK